MSEQTPDRAPDEDEVVPTGAPDALANPEVDEIQASERTDEEDPYQLRSGIPDAPDDSDPASQMNF